MSYYEKQLAYAHDEEFKSWQTPKFRMIFKTRFQIDRKLRYYAKVNDKDVLYRINPSG
jgi:hypothetical protein